MSRRAAALALCAALLLAALPFSGCRAGASQYTSTWWDVFDTVTVLTGYADSQAEWDAQAEALHDDLLRFHRLFDIYHEYDGVVNLAALNARAGQGPVTVDAELMGLLLLTKEAYTLTGGKCNAAGGTVLALWHDAREAGLASPETAALPDEAALAEAGKHTDINALLLDETACTVAFADPALKLDVGGIAKGYAAEQAARAAVERGLTSALLSVGGNLRAIGQKPDGSPWTAGVDDPWPDENGQYNTAGYVAAVALRDGESLVISGDYQRYYTVDGVRYAHLIDPDTLYPARYVSSVAVLCTDSGLADALSTGLFCQPVEDGLALVERLDGVEALWLGTDKTLTRSSGFAEREQG